MKQTPTLGEHCYRTTLTHGKTGGACRVLNPLKELSDKEERMLEECVKYLKVDIELGEGLWKRFGAVVPLSIF